MNKVYLKESEKGSGRFVEYNHFKIGTFQFSIKTGREYKRLTPGGIQFPPGSFWFDWNGTEEPSNDILLAPSNTKWYSRFFVSILGLNGG